MNDQRSDDDRKGEQRDPEQPDERTPGPDDAPGKAPHAGTEDGVDTETDASGSSAEPDEATAPGEEGAVRGAEDDTETPAEAEDAGGNGRGGTAAAGPPSRRGGRWVVALALLIALAAAGAAGWLGWRLVELERRVESIPAERSDALEPLAERAELQALESEFGQRLQAAVDDKAQALVSARDEALGAVRERLATLEAGVEEIRELAARDQIEWRLAEIRYLLAIAQRRVLIDRDTRSAIAALEAADRAIAEFGDVRLLPLRQRIVDDLAALRSVETADIEGIALRLQNLLGHVPDLPLAGSQTTVTAGQDDGTAGWWNAMVARLDRFVTVRRRDAGPEPGRPQPATELPEGDRLVLALERARSAALARDPMAYRRSLERATQALDSGFAADAPATERFREGLAWLRERPVEVALPDLTPTVELAEQLSARIESSHEETPAGAEEERAGDSAGESPARNAGAEAEG
jgi:uroporphyrin-3 C-methyltransferase